MKEFKSKSIHLHHNVDILIVGGGLSGLLAAKKLAGTQYDVLLVERENILGGVLKNTKNVTFTHGIKPSKLNAEMEKTPWMRRALWALYAFVPSSLMLGTTTFVSMEIGSFPLLWGIPLTLYLLTFVIVFMPKPILNHRWMLELQPYLLIPLILWLVLENEVAQWSTFALAIAYFFVAAMVCHGELYKNRPQPAKLT